MTGDLCEALRAPPLGGRDYEASAGEIIAGLEERWRPTGGWSGSMHEGRSRFLEGLRIWRGVFEDLSTFGELGRFNRVASKTEGWHAVVFGAALV